MAHNNPVMTQRKLRLMKWLMVLLPPVAVFLYETVRHGLLENGLGTLPGNLAAGFLTLLLAYAFAEILFRALHRFQEEALTSAQEVLTMNAVMEERNRLSRELHDGAAQLVANLLLRLDTIKELVHDGRHDEAQAELERLHRLGDEIYEDIGASITGLRANVTDHGLVRALRDYVDQFEERYQIPTTFQADGGADHMPPLASFQLFRFVQEGLTNVRKHAKASQACVTLTSRPPSQLEVTIADDGKGMALVTRPNSRSRPLGLTGMRERVEALDGDFSVCSEPGSGTRVTATVPTSDQRIRRGEHAAATTPIG